MIPNLLTSLGILLALLGTAAMATWEADSMKQPLLFRSMGVMVGEALLLIMQIVMTVGGISLAIWGFIYADWYVVLIVFVSSLALVKALPVISHDAISFLTSAFGPIVCAAGVVLLHFFTWFAN